MSTVLDYVSTATQTFAQRPFNAVDALALACLSYQNMPGIVATLSDTTERYGTLGRRLRHLDFHHPAGLWKSIWTAPFDGPTVTQLNEYLKHHDFIERHGPTGLADPHLTERLYDAAAQSPRFGPLIVCAFERRFSVERQTQFAAETFLLPDGTLAIAFQGTDDSFVGWKEDFNMAFQYPVPAQESALDYLETVAGLWRGPIILLGHSKGGNLAFYAALNATDDTRARISHVYCLDGPGFPETVVDSNRYRDIIGVVDKIVPTSSIVGMILETPEPCIVVQSTQRGIMQHLAFSWQVEQDHFIQVPSVSPGSQFFNRQLNLWLRGMTTEQRQQSVDALFSILAATGNDGFTSMMTSLPKAIPEMFSSFVGLSEQDRRNIRYVANLLLRVRFGIFPADGAPTAADASRPRDTSDTAPPADADDHTAAETDANAALGDTPRTGPGTTSGTSDTSGASGGGLTMTTT